MPHKRSTQTAGRVYHSAIVMLQILPAIDRPPQTTAAHQINAVVKCRPPPLVKPRHVRIGSAAARLNSQATSNEETGGVQCMCELVRRQHTCTHKQHPTRKPAYNKRSPVSPESPGFPGLKLEQQNKRQSKGELWASIRRLRRSPLLI